MSFAASDGIASILKIAIDGLTDRQNVIANNLANIDTPHFISTSVEFESSLQQAISRGEFNDSSSNPQVLITAQATDTPVGANGNNVDLRKEEMAMLQTQYSYQIIGRALSDHYNLIKQATVMS